jgi:hypothetical protein
MGTSVIPALGRLSQEDHEFQASLGYIWRTCLKNKQTNKKKMPVQGVLVQDLCEVFPPMWRRKIGTVYQTTFYVIFKWIGDSEIEAILLFSYLHVCTL